MEQFKGKLCYITVDFKGELLYFKGVITEVDQTHIYFIDRLNEHRAFKRSDIKELQEVRGNGETVVSS